MPFTYNYLAWLMKIDRDRYPTTVEAGIAEGPSIDSWGIRHALGLSKGEIVPGAWMMPSMTAANRHRATIYSDGNRRFRGVIK